MIRSGNSRFLLFIEPAKEEKTTIPIEDEITGIVRIALSEARTGISNYNKPDEDPEFIECNGYKGYHLTDCGERSAPYDFLLANGMITNSLCLFYLQYYRNSIPAKEMVKVHNLIDYYKIKYHDHPALLSRLIRDVPKVDFESRIRRLFDEEQETLSW